VTDAPPNRELVLAKKIHDARADKEVGLPAWDKLDASNPQHAGMINAARKTARLQLARNTANRREA
jgi:hypothetical protein